MNLTRNIGAALAILTSTVLFAAQPSTETVAPDTRISVADFGAIPNDGNNAAPALRAAIEFARHHPGIVLYFPPGIYNFRDDDAIRLMDQAMTGKLGPNPESVVFKPYYPYTRGLDFRGLAGVTVEAHGAILLCDGWMEPLSLDQAKDIRIRGLTIDYRRRAYSAGTVIAVGDGYFDAAIESQYPINARMPIPRVMFWDPKAHQDIGESGVEKIEILAAQTVRVYTNEPIPSRIQGSQVALVHSMHFRPAILIQQSDNIHLQDVTIHSQPGMGIVAHRSSNIILTGLRIVPAPGSFISTTTDATHFTSCTGLIRIEDSQFEGHGDDGTNIHNYYYSVAKAKSFGRYDLTLPVDTHAGVLDYPDVGDSLDLVRADSLEPIKSLIVQSVAIYPREMRTEVAFNANLPDDLDHYYVINTTRLPRVEIVGSSFLSHRARGVLIKTRNVLIERNLFFENTGTAVQIAAEGGWREGVPSANVVIRNNRMIGNGRGAGAIDGTSGIVVNIGADKQDVAGLHRGLLIEGNAIEGAGTDKCISISQADDVEIRYNELSGCRKPIDVKHSTHVNIHDNAA
jgi:hypothetical protein